MSGGGNLDKQILNSLREIMGDEFDDLVETFIVNTESMLDQISASIKEGDSQVVTRLAHSIKSSSANVGALRVSEQAALIEELASADKLYEISNTLQNIESEFNAVRAALEEYATQ
ncbi:MAG: Hpt domain-containing protein [Gammaproteobacteria bacterium]